MLSNDYMIAEQSNAVPFRPWPRFERTRFATFVDAPQYRAERQPSETAYVFMSGEGGHKETQLSGAGNAGDKNRKRHPAVFPWLRVRTVKNSVGLVLALNMCECEI